MPTKIIVSAVFCFCFLFNLKIFATDNNQDLIFTKRIVLDTISCKIQSITKDRIIFFESSHPQTETSILKSKVIRCEFSKINDLIIIPKILIDTVSGTIKSVNKNYLTVNKFQDERYSEEVIPVNNMFACKLGIAENSEIVERKIKNYLNETPFLEVFNEPIVNINDNKELKVKELSLENDKLNVQIVNARKQTISSFLRLEDLKSIEFSKFNNNLNSSNLVLLTEIADYDINITDISSNDIAFETKLNNKVVNTIINRDGKSYLLFVPDGATSSTYKDYNHTGNNQNSNESVKIFEVLLRTGYGYRIAKISPDLAEDQKNHVKKLCGSLNFGGEINFNLNRDFGIGARMDYSRSSTSNKVNMQFTNGIFNVDLKETVSIVSFGPAFTGHSYLEDARLSYTINPIFIYYMDDAIISDASSIEVNGKGNCFGLSGAFRSEFMAKNSICPFVEFSFLFGTIKELDVNYGGNTAKQKTEESLARIQLSIGIMIH